MKKRNFNRLSKNKYGYVFLVLMLIIIVPLGVWKLSSLSPVSHNIDDITSIEKTDDVEEKKMALVATKNLVYGDFVTVGTYKEILTDSNTIPLDIVEDPKDLLNKRIKSPINEGEPIQKSKLVNGDLWYGEDDRFTEYTFVEGTIPKTLPNEKLVGSLVDIILYRQGELDLVVLSKVVIVAQNENNLGFHLTPNEDEYLREAGAEGNFYFRLYLDESQKASEVTYIPSFYKGE